MIKRGIERYLHQQQVDEFYKINHIDQPGLSDISLTVMKNDMVLLNVHLWS